MGHANGHDRGWDAVHEVGRAVDGVHDPQPLLGQEALQRSGRRRAATADTLLAQHCVIRERLLDGRAHNLRGPPRGRVQGAGLAAEIAPHTSSHCLSTTVTRSLSPSFVWATATAPLFALIKSPAFWAAALATPSTRCSMASSGVAAAMLVGS